jgi:hypothetical protein
MYLYHVLFITINIYMVLIVKKKILEYITLTTTSRYIELCMKEQCDLGGP